MSEHRYDEKALSMLITTGAYKIPALDTNFIVVESDKAGQQISAFVEKRPGINQSDQFVPKPESIMFAYVLEN